MIADLHAITNGHDPKSLAQHTLSTAALYLAAGLDPENTILFVQSQVPAHTQLMHLLNCITPTADLNQMMQFKQKANGKTATVGLYDYPILMAADILLYCPELVSVGQDQTQHLELTRRTARRFNRQFGDTFTEPKPLMAESLKIMSLTHAASKMSKSNPCDRGRINLLDTPETIRLKIQKAKTDSIPGLTFDPKRPEIFNLLTLYQQLSGKSQDEILAELVSASTVDFKTRLTDLLIATLTPIQQRYHDLMKQPEILLEALQDGQQKANQIAQTTLAQASNKIGLLTIS